MALRLKAPLYTFSIPFLFLTKPLWNPWLWIQGDQFRLSLRPVFFKKVVVLDVLPFCKMYIGKQKDLQWIEVEVHKIYRLYTD